MAFGNPFTRFVYNRSPAALRSFMATVYSRGRGRRKFGPKFDEHLADLQRTQWYSDELLLSLQEEKLRRIVWQAAQFVPYYRASFAAHGIRPEEISDRNALTKLPIVEKSELKAR